MNQDMNSNEIDQIFLFADVRVCVAFVHVSFRVKFRMRQLRIAAGKSCRHQIRSLLILKGILKS